MLELTRRAPRPCNSRAPFSITSKALELTPMQTGSTVEIASTRGSGSAVTLAPRAPTTYLATARSSASLTSPTTDVAASTIGLPYYADMTQDEVERVAHALIAALD